MKDIKGNEIQVGDTVVFAASVKSSCRLRTGKVTKIYKGTRGNTEECSVEGCSHVLGNRILKLTNETVNEILNV